MPPSMRMRDDWPNSKNWLSHVDAYFAEVKGKYIDELDVPKTELEEEWEAEKLF